MSMLRRFHVLLTWSVLFGILVGSICLPQNMQPSWVAVMFAMIVIALGIELAAEFWNRKIRRQGNATAVLAIERELPIILVAGPYSASLFSREGGNSVLRRNADAVWMRAETPAKLAEMITLVTTSHGRAPNAVLIPVVPEGNTDEGMLRQEFAQWQHSLAEAMTHPACALPCYLAVYACLGSSDLETPKPRWFGDAIDIGCERNVGIIHARTRMKAIRVQLERNQQVGCIGRDALGVAVLNWLDDSALLSSLSTLANTSPFILQGLLLADIGYMPVRAGAWTRWLTGKTGLQPRFGKPVMQPLPLPIVKLSKAVWARTKIHAVPPWHSVCRVVPPVLLMMALAFAISTTVNYQMIERTAQDIRAYWRTPYEHIRAKEQALAKLDHTREEIEFYARNGVPVRLGWGLYQGETLLLALNRAISSYRPISRLMGFDSLALFDSGKATLSSGAAEKDLRGMLRLIIANPDQHVLIIGHTDNQGNGQTNFSLSEARARVIRDWFVTEGSLPAARFTIQAYGDSRPIADNHDAAGRSKNRRVEIILTPTSGDQTLDTAI